MYIVHVHLHFLKLLFLAFLSRYSAFSYRIVDYVMESTHESCRDWRQDKVAWANDLDRSGMFDSFDFVKLVSLPDDDCESFSH